MPYADTYEVLDSDPDACDCPEWIAMEERQGVVSEPNECMDTPAWDWVHSKRNSTRRWIRLGLGWVNGGLMIDYFLTGAALAKAEGEE